MIFSLEFVTEIGRSPSETIPSIYHAGICVKGKFCTLRHDDELIVVMGPSVLEDKWDEDYFHRDIMFSTMMKYPEFTRAGGGYYRVVHCIDQWKIQFYGESAGFGRFCKLLLRKQALRELEARFGLPVEVN